MGRPDHDLVDPRPAGRVDQGVQGRYNHLRPFEGETLLADEGLVQELLELFGPDQIPEDAPLPGRGKIGLVAAGLHIGQEPVADRLVLDMEKLDSEGRAVGLLEGLQDLPQGRLGRFHSAAGGELPIQVLLGQPKGVDGELLVGAFSSGVEVVPTRLVLGAQGIEVGVEVAHVPVGPEQAVHAALFGASVPVLGGSRNQPRCAILGDAVFTMGSAQIEGPPLLEIAEKGLPAAVYGGGIPEPGLVELLDELQACKVQQVVFASPRFAHPLAPEFLLHEFGDLIRPIRHRHTGLLEGFDLGLRSSLAPGYDGPGMSHPFSRRCGAP